MSIRDELNEKHIVFTQECLDKCGRKHPVKGTIWQGGGKTDIHCDCGCKFTVKWEKVIL